MLDLRTALRLDALASGSLALTACSAGSIGGGDSEGGGDSITFLTNNSPVSLADTTPIARLTGEWEGSSTHSAPGSGAKTSGGRSSTASRRTTELSSSS